MKCLFSIIVPIYNVAPYLRACLDSLCTAVERLHRVNPYPVEIICIDDGSTDESGTILDNYVDGKDFFKIIHQANKGLGPARNRGMDIASGEWMLFVDSDDEVTPDYLTVILEIAEKYAPDSIRFGYVNVEKLGNDCDSYGGDTCCIEADGNPVTFFQAMNSAFAWNVAYRRMIVGNLRYEPITPGEDVLFSCAMIPRLNKIAVTTVPIYHYLQRVGSLAHKKEISLRQIESCGISTVKRIEYLRQWPHFTKVRRELFKMVRTTYVGQGGLMLGSVSDGDRKEAWRSYCRYGRQIFASGADYMPLVARMIGGFVFRHESIVLWKLVMFLPWRLRVLLLEFAFVRRCRNFVRGARSA